MKLIKSFEKTSAQGQRQELVISADASSKAEASSLNYDDFSIKLIVAEKGIILDVTALMWEAGMAERIIDSVNWVEEFANQSEEVEA
jgi:hypothetical protein